MRRLVAWLAFLAGMLFVPTALAQPAGGEAAADEDEDWDDEEEGGDDPQLRPPDMGSMQLDLENGEEGDEGDEGDEGEGDEGDEGDEGEGDEGDSGDDELPSPGDAQNRLDQGGPGDGTDPTIARWTTPQTVFDLHGYLRFRGEFQDNFFFDRVNQDNSVDLPFRLFRPAEDGMTPAGGCASGDTSAVCSQHANAFANMRLRLEPTIHLSDDVRVRMQIDVFDNMVLGSTPNSLAYGPYDNGGYIDPYYRYDRTTMAPIDTLNTTLVAPQAGLNSISDSIVARRAWAEVRNRTLGELRFGRMGSHWGLGILANGGTGIDSDYQTDVDRIMLITRLAGITIFGAWDFTSEGLLYQERADLGGIAFDRSRLDDTDQFVVGAAYRATEEEQRAALQRGDAVFNIGGYFIYRNQNLSSGGTTNPLGLCVICNGSAETDAMQFGDPFFVRRGADVFVPDLWMQFVYEKLRLELEAVMVLGTIQNLSNTGFEPGEGNTNAAELLQFGIAFEGEYHLLNDQLGIYFNAGYASGDADQEGLSQIGGLNPQLPAGPDRRVDRTYSTFYFHPNYRVDLILWRNVLRQVGGAYYFRPGISYDFIRNSFGQLLGARADVVWSRASVPIQSWGNADDLGVEIDVQVYYRSEDGPDLLDGFYASAQWGILFPLDGLGWLPGLAPTNASGGERGLGNAQTFRLILGVQY
ncbi:MAG: TIGR04551 family protein [Myxococcales bacterium]|nr:TIGR04551 family protein [Myxococcales bacterium]